MSQKAREGVLELSYAATDQKVKHSNVAHDHHNITRCSHMPISCSRCSFMICSCSLRAPRVRRRNKPHLPSTSTLG